MDNKQPGKDVSPQDLLDKFPLVAKSSQSVTPVTVNNLRFGLDLIVFAGPNMVESEELIVDIAKFLKSQDTHFLRGGAFKPLTFPYRSEKYTETREDGIRWLRSAKDETGIGIITEVMEIKYLPLVCEVADIIQIGARNMQNYPLIIEAAKTRKPIMLKRHFGCSIRDLLGAAEYILSNGNPNVILCERGISAPHTHRSTSRFLLDLQAVPALKELTHLPIAVDPSHACFWAPWVQSLALASVASGADAVMLEVHPDPSNAAVDPLQAINYDEYKALFAKMNLIRQVLNQ